MVKDREGKKNWKKLNENFFKPFNLDITPLNQGFRFALVSGYLPTPSARLTIE